VHSRQSTVDRLTCDRLLHRFSVDCRLSTIDFFKTMEPDVPGLLARWAQQDPAARDELVALVYGELRKIAHHYLRHEREGHTLQTDALVNEAYLRLAGVDRLQWRDRTHFFAIAAMLMRRVLVDYARE